MPTVFYKIYFIGGFYSNGKRKNTIVVKPPLTLVLSDVDHGKTTLTGSYQQRYFGTSPCLQQLTNLKTMRLSMLPPEERERGITINTAHVSTKTENVTTSHRRSRTRDYVKNMITGAARMDGAILVASTDGPMLTNFVSTSFFSRQVGVKTLSSSRNKIDLVDDEELLELAEMEIRDLFVRIRLPR